MSRPPQPPIYNDISEIIGNTPIVRLNISNINSDTSISTSNDIELLAKLEYTNCLSGSIKDRVAKKILSDAEKSNKIGPNSTLLIPTSGNLGISIALLAQRKGYKTIALVPERTSIDRIRILKSLGVEIIRTPNEARPGHAESNFDLAIKLSTEIANSVVIDEFTNQSNVQAHYEETSEEIYTQVNGKLDILVVGVESGGTITGLAKNLKGRIPGLKVLKRDYFKHNLNEFFIFKKDQKVEDIGNNFTPSILDVSLIDAWIKVSDKESFAAARKLISEGFMAGPSSGSVVNAALSYIQKNIPPNNKARILCILNDTARNYSSTLLSEDWLLENDLMDEQTIQRLEYQRIEKYRAASVEDLQLPAAVTVLPNVTIAQALDLMVEREFSQLPVTDSHRKLLGYVSLTSLQDKLDSGDATLTDEVSKWMFTFGSRNSPNHRRRQIYQIITPDTPLYELAKFFEKHSFAIVTDSERKWALAVTTKMDLIRFLRYR
ncbi:tryptophan synthase beta subunit-like PLP-dependent enzyme [Gigaspora rosea]|uniref:cystathionine beta-synthase n=1 Tax=Gigaspora rosea TaxID=44941 RepID=A0A397W199_9GLOM|nr:tryptophan synthase beta subunit-like PLP-dependent enzyme [Gigaspora rosea]